MREGRGFAIRTLERRGVGTGSDEDIPAWKAAARELMAGLRNELSESRSRWAGENAARRQETRKLMIQLQAEFGHGEPAELPDMVEVDCGCCGGQGSLPGSAKCPVCWGKGKVRVKAPYEKCDLCKGTGQVRGMALTCSKCKGKGWIHVQRKPNACPRCGGSGLEPGEELSLTALRERRREGLPPPRRGMAARPLCALCDGTGVAYLDTRAAPAGSRTFGAAKNALPALEGAESEVTEEQPPAQRSPISRDPLVLEEKMLGYVMSYPGVKPEDMEIVFGLSGSEVDGALRSLTKSGKLRKESGIYYPTPSASPGSLTPKVLDGIRSEAKQFVGRLLDAVSHAKGQDA